MDAVNTILFLIICQSDRTIFSALYMFAQNTKTEADLIKNLKKENKQCLLCLF